MAQRHTTSLALRLRYRFDNLMAGGTTALIGWFALACLAVVVPASTVLVWADRAAPATLSGRLAAVWVSVGQTLKIGGAVGSPLYVLASVALALVALLFVSTLVGLITTGINRRIMLLRRGHSTVLESGHTVLLGWSDQIFPVVGELVAANANRHRSAIAVLAPKDKVEMEEEISTSIAATTAGTGIGTGTTRIICRNGRTTDPTALARVSPRTAKAVLVLPPEGDTGDAQVVKTLLALDAAVPEPGAAVVVAAVRDTRSHLTARLAAGPGGHVLCVDDIIARLLVQTAREPGLSLVYQELLDFAGDEFYTAAAQGLAGRTFGEALLAFSTSSVVGLLHADGGVALNPDPSTTISAGDRIILISEDDDTAVPADASSCVDEDAIVTARSGAPEAERLLLLGWNRRAPLVVEQLDQFVGPGSTLDVVSLADEVRTRAASGVTEACSHLEVAFRRGDITDPELLAKLDVPAYDRVIVIGETGHEPIPHAATPPPARAIDLGLAPETGTETDDRTLVTLLHLRAIGEAAGREPSLTTEMSDDGNRLLAPAREGADFIVSGRLISLLMTQISESPYLAAVFEELFEAEGNELHLKPVADYVRTDREVTFATLVESARRRRECAVGYRLRAGTATGPAYGVRLNPDKRQRVRFGEHDWLIVLAES
ncbi:MULTISPECIES: CASTOR/POLLUX-related putative ion channel [unclassified Streptomyces]|uniref:CASTOR/POLLUX-related putative ion channel n=1 Tax=unclassified Streptomyces TaxID=2593676 RepID=UPI002E16414F|nr:NAD-binding lipoprotein [Streptomyces sp. NBC_01207]WTA17341.1 NAD-binding lipoprotein [Streptomyces sp. NBC_00853]